MSLYLGDVVRAGSLPHLWRTWWLGDLVGCLIVVPLVIAWVPLPKPLLARERAVEAGLLLVMLVTLGTVSALAAGPLNGLVVPALIWAALRFGRRGVTLAVAVGAGFTVWGAVHYLGGFHLESLDRTLLETQLYLSLSTLSVLALAALASERDEMARSARESRERIVRAADEERRRIERNVHDGAQQRLVALSAHLSLAAIQARTKPTESAALFESAQAELQVAIDELRELVHGMRPQALRQYGLSRAIELLAARSASHIELVELPEVRLDETAEVTAYYVVVEAITNAERYAFASVIQVRAWLDSTTLRIEIADDGIGGAVIQDDLGLQGLQDRIEATGGTFAVDSGAGSGTKISAAIPHATRARTPA
jgi:signal transduction histidine kinase